MIVFAGTFCSQLAFNHLSLRIFFICLCSGISFVDNSSFILTMASCLDWNFLIWISLSQHSHAITQIIQVFFLSYHWNRFSSLPSRCWFHALLFPCSISCFTSCKRKHCESSSCLEPIGYRLIICSGIQLYILNKNLIEAFKLINGDCLIFFFKCSLKSLNNLIFKNNLKFKYNFNFFYFQRIKYNLT